VERKFINDNFSVSGQIALTDIADLKSQGIKTLICNRPDSEDVSQLEADVVKFAAEKEGLEFFFIPVVSGQITQAQSEEFARVIERAPKPIHAYCRSGTRCTILWALTQLLAGQDKQTILETTAKAGYDLSNTFT